MDTMSKRPQWHKAALWQLSGSVAAISGMLEGTADDAMPGVDEIHKLRAFRTCVERELAELAQTIQQRRLTDGGA